MSLKSQDFELQKYTKQFIKLEKSSIFFPFVSAVVSSANSILNKLLQLNKL